MLRLNVTNDTNDTFNHIISMEDASMFQLIKIVNATVYVTIFIFGLFGNAAVCYIISCRLRQSATSVFLLNLSLADLLMALFCVPITLVSDCLLYNWVFGRAMCHIFPFIQGVSVFLSALTHTAIAIDRYFVVFHPLRRQNFPIKQAVFIVAGIWIFAIIVISPLLYVSKLSRDEERNQDFCHEVWPSENMDIIYSLTVMGLQYVLPLIVIVLTYSAIAVRIWFYQTPGESIRSRDEAIATSKKKMIKMFIIVAMFYSLSQLPRHIIYLISYYNTLKPSLEVHQFWNQRTAAIMNVTHLLSMSACFYNPILYIWLNSSFRKSLTNMMTCARSTSAPPTSPKWATAFPDVPSCKRRLSISSNNALLNTKLHERRFL